MSQRGQTVDLRPPAANGRRDRWALFLWLLAALGGPGCEQRRCHEEAADGSGGTAATAASVAEATAEVKLVDVPLVDQDGVPTRLPEVVGDRVVVLDFVYTSCTTVCPVLGAIFERLGGAFGERLGQDVRLVSITVDPVRDTPAALKAYAARHRAPAGWTFLTGSQENVDRVLQGLGGYGPDLRQHAPVVLVGDGRTGRWARFNSFLEPERIQAKAESLLATRPALMAGPAVPTASVASPTAGGGELAAQARARSYFTDTLLLSEEGRPVRFYSDLLDGRVVVISFLFTRCRATCPLLTHKLVQVKQALGERFGRDVHFISISVDPDFDTPKELQKFARRNQALGKGWTFLTGKKENLRAVLGKLGGQVELPDEHSTAFIAGNARTKHWTHVPPDASPAEIAERLRQLIGPS